jgi:hypothetical protein
MAYEEVVEGGQESKEGQHTDGTEEGERRQRKEVDHEGRKVIDGKRS